MVARNDARTTPGLHADVELNQPEHLSDERLVEIVDECLRRWDAFPTIPGSRRWARNGGIALTEIARRLRDTR